MKKLFFTLAAVVLSCGAACAQSRTGEGSLIDLTGVDAFFETVSGIRSGTMPTDEEWNRLFGTGGYKAHLPDQEQRDLFREMILLAFDKSRAEERTTLLKADKEQLLSDWKLSYGQWILKNLWETAQRWDELVAFRSAYDFGQAPVLARGRLDGFMAGGVDPETPMPGVCLLCMEGDGYGGEPITVDFNLFYKMADAGRIDFLAHEMFHNYRHNLKPGYYEWIWENPTLKVLNSWQDEGIADLIDKGDDPVAGLRELGVYGFMVDQYILRQNSTPETLRRVDSLTCGWLRKEIDQDTYRNGVGEAISMMGGHPNGFYMSRYIEKAGLREEMLRTFDSPFEFTRLYNRAAEKLGGYRFSREFMEYLDRLEEQAPR